MLGLPQQGAGHQILLAETRQLMGACDARHAGAAQDKRGEAQGTPRFSIPPLGMEAAVAPIPLDVPRSSAPHPGPRAAKPLAREGWQALGSFPRMMEVLQLREGAIWKLCHLGKPVSRVDWWGLFHSRRP